MTHLKMKLMAIGLGIAAWVAFEGSICQTTFLSNAALPRPILNWVPKDTREK